MEFLKLFIVVLLAAACSADEDLENIKKIVVPCSVKDPTCLRESIQDFVQRTHAGLPTFDIRSIDPITFETLLLTLSVDKNIGHRLSNCTVKGYKDQHINEYKIDTAAKLATIKSRADLNYNCSLTIYFYQENVITELGHQEMTASVYLDATFQYSLTNVGGVEYFEIAEEELGCHGAPDVPGSTTLDPGALEKLNGYSSVIPKMDHIVQHSDMYIKKCMCAVAKYTYGTAVNNLRAATRVPPTSVSFKDYV